MVVGVKTVKVLCSNAVSNPDYQGDKQEKNISVVEKENYQKKYLSCETGMRSSSWVKIELLIC